MYQILGVRSILSFDLTFDNNEDYLFFFYQWQNNRPALESNGERILAALKKGTAIAADPGETPPPAPDVAKRCFQQLANSYEEEYGGFREAPKFPSPGRLRV